MKGVLIGALFACAFLLFAKPASAMTEFCPSQLHYAAAGAPQDVVQSASPQPASLYGFNLSALGPRTVTATLAFDTSAGWYTVVLPAMTLTEKDRHYDQPGTQWLERDWISPTAYVRFPQPVTIRDAWVHKASAVGDGKFGWQAEGEVTCKPTAIPAPDAHPSRTIPNYAAGLEPQDRDRLSDQPSATATVFTPRASAALESAACAQPFREGTMSDAVTPDFPRIGAANAAGTVTVTVDVALKGSGKLQDAWIVGSSGSGSLDDATLRAARESRYVGALAYCKPVPSRYLFLTTFVPNGD